MALSVLFKHSDLDEDKGQSIIRNMKSNFFKRQAEQACEIEYLDRQLSSLDRTKKKAELRIMKSMKELKEQAQFLEKEQIRVNEAKAKAHRERSDPDFVLDLSKGIPFSRRTPLNSRSRNKTPHSILKPHASLPVDLSRYCRFQHKKSECKSFPCVPCNNYTDLGFFWSEDDRTDVTSRTRGLSARSKSKLWHEVESSSVLKPLRVPYNKALKQEKALQMNISHMRAKNNSSKPKDWPVRYGDPTPLRKILKPARM